MSGIYGSGARKPVPRKTGVGTSAWWQTKWLEIGRERNKYRDALAQAQRDLELLKVDIENGPPLSLVRREVTHILAEIHKVTDGPTSGQGDGNVDR